MIKTRSTFALPLLLAANAALACGPWLVRLARVDGGVGPIAAGFWRLALALPILTLAAWRIERPRIGVRPAGIVAIGGIAFAADLALWHNGILRTRLANATLLGNFAALLFPLYGFWMARRWPHARQWLALALASVGAVLLLGRSYELSAAHLIGDAACLGAGFCYLGYLVAVDRALGAVPPVATLAISGAVGVPVLLIAAWAAGETIWPHDWTALLLLTIGSQLFGQGLLLYGVSRAAPILVGFTLLSQPIVASAIGWIVYGERLVPADAIGAIGIGVAVLLVRDTQKPAALPPAQAALDSRA